MGTITTPDGVEIFFKDWGSGQPIVFSHGWPLSGDDWDTQMMFFLLHGYRVIAHDRRGHGRSTQTGDGHDMDHYAGDLAALTAHLDLHDAIHVGHSTGGGEVAHYIARHGESRVAKAVLSLQDQVATNRSVFYRDFASGPFYRFNQPVVGMHGDDDQVVPYEDSGPLSAKLVQNGTLKTYSGFPHGMPTTEAKTINANLLAFVQS